MKRMKFFIEIAGVLCFIVFAGMVSTQESLPTNSDRLKKKIDSVSLIYKRTLKRHYEELVSSLDKDIEGLEKLKLLGGTSEYLAGIDGDIRRFTKERADADKMARALELELREEQAVAQPTPGPSQEAAQVPCDCPSGKDAKGRDIKGKLPPGVIWCGPAKNSELSVQTFAERAAPILWFSPNEPLIRNSKLPQPLPSDNTSGPVVYYRIIELVRRQNDVRPEFDGTKLELDKVKKLTLKYYFYYSKDAGFREHPHDLESASKMEVRPLAQFGLVRDST